jgi:pyrimidine-nucleoside phosphorylase
MYLLTAKEEGYIQSMDTEKWGLISVMLGAGRAAKDDEIDYGAGIYLQKKTGDYLLKDEGFGYLYSNNKDRLMEAFKSVNDAYVIGKEKPEAEPLIYEHIR